MLKINLYTKDIGNKMICPMIEDKIMENTIPAYKYKDLSTILKYISNYC